MAKEEKVNLTFGEADTGVLTFQNVDGKGELSWNLETESADIKRRVNLYFSRKQEFKMPLSQKIDDYEIVNVVPTKSYYFFVQALCQLQSDTDILVEWL